MITTIRHVPHALSFTARAYHPTEQHAIAPPHVADIYPATPPRYRNGNETSFEILWIGMLTSLNVAISKACATIVPARHVRSLRCCDIVPSASGETLGIHMLRMAFLSTQDCQIRVDPDIVHTSQSCRHGHRNCHSQHQEH